jgi:hypothetical protein
MNSQNISNVSIENEFKTLQDTVREFIEFDIDKKIDYLKKITQNVSYNTDYQDYLCENKFLEKILLNLENHLHSISESNTQNTSSKEEIIVYVRLFFLLLHNLIIGNSANQIKVFNNLFLNETNFSKLKNLTSLYYSDNRIKKFLLSTIYNLILCNELNLKELKKSHIDYLIFMFSNLNFDLTHNHLSQNKDLSEINDWIHINIKHILKNELTINDELIKDTLCSLLTNPIYNPEQSLLFMQLIRDFVDYAKDSKTLVIGKKNLKVLCRKFVENISNLHEFIDELDKNEFKDFENYKMSENSKTVNNFREFICHVDILSVFLTSEEFPEYRELIQNEINSQLTDLVKAFHCMLTSTDKIYEEVFKRNKLLNQQEAIGVKVIDENSILYGFQTNIMKVLSNLAFKNNFMKEKFVEDPITFYYFLNHLKLDKCNPFKKEWTVLYIKAITENSTKIQNLIEELRPHHIDPLLKDYILNKGNVKQGNQDDLIKKQENIDDE